MLFFIISIYGLLNIAENNNASIITVSYQGVSVTVVGLTFSIPMRKA